VDRVFPAYLLLEVPKWLNWSLSGWIIALAEWIGGASRLID